MKYYLLKPAFFVLFNFFIFSLRAQRVDSILTKFDQTYPQEKLYLQFDKSAYNPGETIWFKAYLFVSNLPSDISKTLYVELLDKEGNVIQRKTAPIMLSS